MFDRRGSAILKRTWNEVLQNYFKIISSVVGMTSKRFYMNGNLCSVVISAFIVRWCVSLYSYSGEKSPPMFGDYEAQRHWMEITVNLPVEEWYFNTTNNNLMYWGLDYPPLTAYHSYVNGKIARLIDPGFVELFTSRGYESYDHKFFMRATVFLSDTIIYFTSVILFFKALNKNHFDKYVDNGGLPDKNQRGTIVDYQAQVSYLLQVAFALLYPGLILIDHGHFQYNSVSLGLTIAAICALIGGQLITCSILFCFALNYKQMSLYHSLPFFVYITSHCLRNKMLTWSESLSKLFLIAATVISTFGFIWLPFLKDRNILIQVVKRLFPVSRGIFEDKVSNFWCTLNIFVKLNKTFTQLQMAKICVMCVLISSLMSLVNLYRYPTIRTFILSLINVSLSFFLFSYQVHEKSVLLVSVPVLLYFPQEPFTCFWFSIISTFSMLPLFVKDNLILPFASMTVLFSLIFFANIQLPKCRDSTGKNRKKFQFNDFVSICLRYCFITSMIGCVILFLCTLSIQPPSKYPDLWPLLTSVYSFLHFSLFFCYFNYVQVFKGKKVID